MAAFLWTAIISRPTPRIMRQGALEAQLTEAGHFAKANVSYPAREAALRAGMGVIGQNGMLITPEYGSRFVIILMATDIVHTAPDCGEHGGCLHCGRCAKAALRGRLRRAA